MATAETRGMTTEPIKPNVLLITRNFPPLTGGMERLMEKAAEGMSSYTRLTIIGPTGCRAYAPKDAMVHEVSFKLLPFLTIGSLAAIRACRKTQFELAIGGSGLAAPTLWILKSLFRLRTAVLIHGLDVVVNNGFYQKLFVPAVCAVDLIIANSHNTRRLAIEKGAVASKLTVINPGTTLPDTATPQQMETFRSRHNLINKKIVLFTGRITRRKGLSQFITHSLPEIIASEPEVVLLVVGDSPDQSLNKQGESEDVLNAVAEDRLEQHVKFLGQVSDADLLTAYAAADVQVLPLIDVPGDVEGFGMVAIEAASAGTPTIAFELGGVPDAISPDNGILVPAGKYTLFADAVVAAISESKPDYASCVSHASKFSWDIFGEKLRTALFGAANANHK